MSDSDNKGVYCRIPPRIVELYGDKFPFEIFIKLKSGKAIRLSNRDDDIKDIYAKYKAKGVESIYVSRNEFEEFIGGFRKKTKNKLFNPATTEEEQVDVLSDAYKVVGEAFKQFGATEDTIEFAKDINKSSIKLLENSPNIFQFFEKFKERVGVELAHIMLTSYLMSMMLDTFEWASDSIKEKASLGCMLCDVLLENDQIKEVRENRKHPDRLSEQCYYHAETTATMLEEKGGTIARETIEIVRYHHEAPDSKGFPHQTSSKNITLLTAIYIVADHFAELLFQNYFDFSRKNLMLSEIDNNYNNANFRNAYFALKNALD